ncbi:MAG: hypothetical protein U0P30_08205 [Vicinamibacterales bacterium]
MFVALTLADDVAAGAARIRDGVSDIGDPLLNAWALAWVARLPTAPAHVFDAGNIFHPGKRGTLAYSETLLAPALIGAPFFWLGAGPIGVYNFLLLLGLAASGVGVAALVYGCTGRRGTRAGGRHDLPRSCRSGSTTTRTSSCCRRGGCRWRCGSCIA